MQLLFLYYNNFIFNLHEFTLPLVSDNQKKTIFFFKSLFFLPLPDAVVIKSKRNLKITINDKLNYMSSEHGN